MQESFSLECTFAHNCTGYRGGGGRRRGRNGQMAKWKSLRGKIDPRVKHDEAQCTARQTRVISAGCLKWISPSYESPNSSQNASFPTAQSSSYLCLSPGVSAARMGLLGGDGTWRCLSWSPRWRRPNPRSARWRRLPPCWLLFSLSVLLCYLQCCQILRLKSYQADPWLTYFNLLWPQKWH